MGVALGRDYVTCVSQYERPENKLHWKGQLTHNIATDITTNRLNRRMGRFSENLILPLKKICYCLLKTAIFPQLQPNQVLLQDFTSENLLAI